MNDETIMRAEQDAGLEGVLQRASYVAVGFSNGWGARFWMRDVAPDYSFVVTFEDDTMKSYSGLPMHTVVRLLERMAAFNASTVSPLRRLDDTL